MKKNDSQFKTVSKKRLNTRNINKRLNSKEVLNNRLKSQNKELRYELAENLENLQEQTARLRKCIVENLTIKKNGLYKDRNRKLNCPYLA